VPRIRDFGIAPGLLPAGPLEAASSALSLLFAAAAEATEEAVYNALVAAKTVAGVDGHLLVAIPAEPLRALPRRRHDA
jgi:D-aminopeptidase